MFFETPTQVKFWDPDGGHYTAGIAYKDEIICGCCGGVFEIEEIIEDAKKGKGSYSRKQKYKDREC